MALRFAWRAGDGERIAQLNDWVLQTRETAELRQQSEQMGRSLVEWLRTVRPQRVEGLAARWTATGSARTDTSLTYPVAFALAVSGTPASAREGLLALAFGWAENMVQAALKSMSLGQSAGQRILATLCAALPAVVEAALTLPDDERQAFTPMLAILSSQHETQYSRLFRS